MIRLTMIGLVLAAPALAADPTSTAQAPAASAPAVQKPDRRCLRETGSRIAGHCVHGTTITREELEQTGQTNLADALAARHPSIRVRH